MGRVPPLSVRLSSEQLERVRGEAGRLGVSVNAFVVGAVETALLGLAGSSEATVRAVERTNREVLESGRRPAVLEELVASGRVSRGSGVLPPAPKVDAKVAIDFVGEVRGKPRKVACPHRVAAGSFCKRCDGEGS